MGKLGGGSREIPISMHWVALDLFVDELPVF